jgi:uncharacterized protein (TIGR03083 family)
MVDDAELAGLDPYALMESEANRLERRFAATSGDGWTQPTRCEGWTVRDLLAHLAASEAYNRACLDGTVQAFLAELSGRGAVDLASANDIGVRELDDVPPGELIELWRTRARENREAFRARDGRAVDSSIGEYPARLQAFHLAFELATHADDVGATVAADEVGARVAWQARFSRFAIRELKPDLVVSAGDGRTHVKGDGVEIDLADEDFVQAVAARLPEDSELGADIASTLSVTP